jgi:signal peptidase
MKTRIFRLLSLALMVLAVAGWTTFLRPTSLGGPADYVIVEGHSMEPTFRSDDVVVGFKQGSYHAGDVVIYRVPDGEPAGGDRVIHRIVGGSAQAGFVLQGDNKDGVDPWRPKPDDIIGKEQLHVPRAGAALVFLRTPLGIALVAGLTTLLVALAGGSARRGNQPPKSASSSASPGSSPSASA